jgi:ribonuclease BN (tRNA processing enzyme)
MTVLGTATPFPIPGNPCSGYLVRFGDDSLWIDAGNGTFAELQRHVHLEELSAVWISHLHADHFGDMPIAYYAYAFGGVKRTQRLRVAGPTGWAQRISSFVSGDHIHTMSDVFDVFELGVEDLRSIGEISIRSQRLQHNIESYGLRIEAAGLSIVYSGDTGPCQEFIEFAKGGDLLLCEVGVDELLDEERTYHCAPEDAGEIASEARVQRLMLTHLSRTLEPEQALRRAGRFFTGPISVATPDSTVTISRIG